MQKQLCMEKLQKFIIQIREFLKILKVLYCDSISFISIEKISCPDCFDITAWTDDNEIMGIKHKDD